MILKEIIEAAGVAYKQKGDEIKLPCPFCGDARPLLSINIRSGLAHCFHCEWKSGGVLYTARQLCKAFGVKYDLYEWLNLDDRDVAEEKAKGVKDILEPIGLPEEYEKFDVANWQGDVVETMAWHYLTKLRKVTVEQIKKHQIGFAGSGTMGWRVLFPVLDTDGECYGCIGRDFTGYGKPKYLDTPGAKLLWNAQREGLVAILVEGVMDALRVENVLIENNSVAIARRGSALSELQLEQLGRFQRIVILPDSDPPGCHAASQAAKHCAEHGLDVSVWVPYRMDERDPGDMSKEEIHMALHAAEPWSKAVEWRLRSAATKVHV